LLPFCSVNGEAVYTNQNNLYFALLENKEN